MERVETHGRRSGARGTVRGGWALWMVALLLLMLTWFSIAGRWGVDDRGPIADWPAKRINVNTAGAAELQLLPGAGPKLADAIIESRQTDGPFTGPDDLRRVKGIGKQLPRRWQPYISFQPSTE